MDHKKIVVLGAGPAGLTAAWKLAEKGYSVEVIEKESQVGGMAQTLRRARVRADFGPHTFHVRDTEESRRMVEAVRSLLKEEPHELKRGTRIRLKDKYFTYPLKMNEVLMGVGPWMALRVLWDYFAANALAWRNPPDGDSSFEEWGVKKLGRTLYDLCFGIYSRKCWGIPTTQLSSKQAQRVANLSLKTLILRMLGIKADPVVYFQRYIYPIGGIGNLYNEMRQRIESHGGNIHLNARIDRLETEGERIGQVVIETPAGKQSIACDGVVSTIPLPILTGLFHPHLSSALVGKSRKLRYRGLRFVYVVVNRTAVTDFHWCYLLEDKFRCNRFSEQKNVAPEMLPKDQTVLCFELGCFKGDDIWNATDAELFDIIMQDVRQMGLFTADEVEDYFTSVIERAYPIYDLGFEENILGTLTGLAEIDNLMNIGRHGLYMNNSMDDNVLLGITLADFIEEEGFVAKKWLEEVQNYMVLRYDGK